MSSVFKSIGAFELGRKSDSVPLVEAAVRVVEVLLEELLVERLDVDERGRGRRR
jgi:hypothetical protein